MTTYNYFIGYAISILLTLAAFGLVWQYASGTSSLSGELILVALTVLGVIQLFVQLVCFLHLGEEKRPRWHLITFVFAAFVVIVVVGGTIWIMFHLDRGHNDLTEIYEGGVISPQTQDD